MTYLSETRSEMARIQIALPNPERHFRRYLKPLMAPEGHSALKLEPWLFPWALYLSSRVLKMGPSQNTRRRLMC